MKDYISREVLENWVREEVASLDSKEDREFVIQRWSADALLAECKEAQKSDPNADGRGWANHFLNAAGEPSTEWYCVEDMIENAPTVDAVPVVRCRDCKHGYPFPGTGFVLCNRPYAAPRETHIADWYCADGKRKEDET